MADKKSRGETSQDGKLQNESLQNESLQNESLQNEDLQSESLKGEGLRGGKSGDTALRNEKSQDKELANGQSPGEKSSGGSLQGEKLRDEIEWMKEMAEQGRNSPVLGGSIGVWWGLLSFIMMLVHWGALTGRLPVSIANIGWFWFAYVVIGMTGMFFLVQRMEQKSGAGTLSNRITGVAWTLAGTGILVFVAGCVIATFVLGAPFWLFNLILPVAFICYGMTFGVVSALRGNRIEGLAAAASFAVALIMFPFVLGTFVYLIGAFAILLVGVLPVVAQGFARA